MDFLTLARAFGFATGRTWEDVVADFIAEEIEREESNRFIRKVLRDSRKHYNKRKKQRRARCGRNYR